MSIVLKDGTELPALPDYVFNEYSCGAVFLLDDDMYILATTSAGLCLMPDGHWVCRQDGYELWSYDFDLEAWGHIDWNTAEPFSTESIGLPEELKLLWTNTDVTDWSSGWFELSDGTKLPPPPDGWSDGTPYGVIVTGNDLIGLVAVSSPLIYFAEVPIGVENQPCVLRLWNYIDDSWTPNTNSIEIPYGTFGADIEGVLWSNHDIMNAMRNEDGTSYTIGTEIARKSDVNYRITEGWVRSIADEARRFEKTTSGFTIDDIEEALKSVEISDLPNAMEVSF